MTLKRSIIFDILEGAEEYPAVGLLGSRQSGKTMLAQLIFKDHAYVSLEDIGQRTAATTDPHAFLNANRNKAGLIIDDFQYVPELLSCMRSEGFVHKQMGEFVLCGPQNASTHELLTSYFEDQISVHRIHSLTIQELLANYLAPYEVGDVLFNGFHPAVYAPEKESISSTTQQVYRRLISDYVEKDVQGYGQVENVTTFHSFLTACAARVGQVVNSTVLAQECGVSDHTVRRWLALLEEQGVIFLLKPYHTSFGKRLIKSPKLYFYDPGIVCSLLNIELPGIAEHSLHGALFETLILSELQRWTETSKKKTHIYFWRDKTEHELEALLEQSDRRISVSVRLKNGAQFERDLKYWHKLVGKQERGFCIGAEHSDRPQHLHWRYLQPLYTALS